MNDVLLSILLGIDVMVEPHYDVVAVSRRYDRFIVAIICVKLHISAGHEECGKFGCLSRACLPAIVYAGHTCVTADKQIS